MTALPSRQGGTPWQRRQEALLAGYPPSPSSARRVYGLLLNEWHEAHGRRYDPGICAGCGTKIVPGQTAIAFNKASVHAGQNRSAQIKGLPMLYFYRALTAQERSDLAEAMPAFAVMAMELSHTPWCLDDPNDIRWKRGLRGLSVKLSDYERHLQPFDRLGVLADQFAAFDCLTAYGSMWRGEAQRGLEKAGVTAPYGWKH